MLKIKSFSILTAFLAHQWVGEQKVQKNKGDKECPVGRELSNMKIMKSNIALVGLSNNKNDCWLVGVSVTISFLAKLGLFLIMQKLLILIVWISLMVTVLMSNISSFVHLDQGASNKQESYGRNSPF